MYTIKVIGTAYITAGLGIKDYSAARNVCASVCMMVAHSWSAL